MDNSHIPFIAVHVGAGNHSGKLEKRLAQLCKAVCNEGIEKLALNGGALECAIEACKKLECNPNTNAGFGSPLNDQGKVECDSSIIISPGIGASVGAISKAYNPIEVAGNLLKNLISKDKKDPFGRIKPSFLVGEGADDFAKESNCQLIDDDKYDLIAHKSITDYIQWKSYIKSASSLPIQDTVGVICGDKTGKIVVCASSGGVALKHPGRVGPAALIGSGIELISQNQVTVASCTSGSGEDIMMIQAANKICNQLMASGSLDKDWIELHLIEKYAQFTQQSPLYMGALHVISTPGAIEIGYWHTTESMIMAYSTGSKHHAHCHISKQEKPFQLVMGGWRDISIY